jgi:FlaA1/EpsC-like NDP-sugar epimerase
MEQHKKLGLAIVGGGQSSLELLRLFQQEKSIEILGVADKRPEAPAIKYAQSADIPTATDFRQLIKRDGVDIIADLTGNPAVRSQILKEKSPHVELLGGLAAKILWSFIEMLERKVAERTREVKEVQEELLRHTVTMRKQILSVISHPYVSDETDDDPKSVQTLNVTEGY